MFGTFLLRTYAYQKRHFSFPNVFDLLFVYDVVAVIGEVLCLLGHNDHLATVALTTSVKRSQVATAVYKSR